MIPESAENESKKILSNILIIGVFQEADTKAFPEVCNSAFLIVLRRSLLISDFSLLDEAEKEDI